MNARMRRLSARLRLSADPDLPVGRLVPGDRQKVEILKQLVAGARVLILDEPTKVLAPQEADGLFRTLTELRDEGFGIVLITHKIREVLASADRVVVMRRGRIAGALPRAEASEARLLSLMFGDARPEIAAPPARGVHGGEVLALEAVSTAAGLGETALKNVSLRLNASEILGIAGVSGNGQRALADLALGLAAADPRGQAPLGGGLDPLVGRKNPPPRRRQHSR